jgi:cysteine desulfurase/selenocysteine lyase
MIPLTESGELRLDALDELTRDGNVKLIATNLVSNSLGTINDVTKIAQWAHEHGALYVCDAAQAAPHIALDVQALGCDFLAFSAHKLCGPSGAGVVWGRAELLEQMEPFLLGGHMIRKVRLEETTWGELPHKFEAGTAPLAEAVGLGAAIDYVTEIGFDAIAAHEHELTAYALERLSEIDGVTLYGPPAERRAGIVSFNIENIHPHDVAQVLDMDGVAIRAGHHCCQPLMTKLGVAATNRASFYVYTIQEEVDRLVDGVKRAKQLFA